MIHLQLDKQCAFTLIPKSLPHLHLFSSLKDFATLVRMIFMILGEVRVVERLFSLWMLPLLKHQNCRQFLLLHLLLTTRQFQSVAQFICIDAGASRCNRLGRCWSQSRCLVE
uniref:Putative ovule protein n=1 Tax=Solanum chacoense TaxID=4108 RepID=A0A0V0H6U6_SOLCH